MMKRLVLTMGLCVGGLWAWDKPDVCTPATAAGTYTVSCTGWTSGATGLTPIAQVGFATGDRDGNFTGFTAINIGGQLIIPKAVVSGKATVNPDCTGNITYNKGTPSEVNITFVINPQTKETTGMTVDRGSVITCTLKSTGK